MTLIRQFCILALAIISGLLGYNMAQHWQVKSNFIVTYYVTPPLFVSEPCHPSGFSWNNDKVVVFYNNTCWLRSSAEDGK